MELGRYNENNISDVCVWDEIFNDNERIVLQDGFLVTGLLSVIFSAWLSVTLLFTSLRFDRSYRNLANYTTVACIRRAVPLMLDLSLFRCLETLYTFRTYSCELFAFLETFLAVFEVECLTHVCIERYVLAKYVTNGWQVKQNHYNLYVRLCLFFSCLYSVPPLFGLGRYSYDFQCTSCTFDVILPNTWQRYIVVAIFALRSIKPTIVMVLMLLWAGVLESKFPCTMKHHLHFTRSVVIITIVNLLCWTPVALIRMRVLVSQLMFVDLLSMTTAYYVTWAMWIHWTMRHRRSLKDWDPIRVGTCYLLSFIAQLIIVQVINYPLHTLNFISSHDSIKVYMDSCAAPALTAIALFLADDRVRRELFSLHASTEESSKSNDTKKD